MRPEVLVSDVVTRDLSQLREITGKVVGNVFFGSMLKMMRESRIQGSIGHGGRGEDVFSGQLHGVLAERMGVRSRGGLVDELYQRLERQQRLITGHRAVSSEDPSIGKGAGSDPLGAVSAYGRNRGGVET